MKFAFDEHVPRGIVKVFQILADVSSLLPITEVVSARIYVHSDDKGDDQHWIRRYSRDGGSFVLSGDKKMRGRPHELKALVDEKMIVFFFSPVWNKKNGYVKSAMLLNWWPKIVEVAQSAPSGSLWPIPFQWTWTDLNMLKVPSDE